MVTLSHSLDIPKAERSRNFSETDIISAKCSFSARSYLYRIFKLKEGCTPTEWREKMAENVAAEDKKQDQPFFDKYQEYTSQNEKIR
jgi:AraC-like DNA-binding protein